MDIKTLTANLSISPQILPSEMQAVAEAGFTDDQFLRTVYTLSSSVFGVVAFLYQGRMALYYHRRRAAITAALDADSDSEQ